MAMENRKIRTRLVLSAAAGILAAALVAGDIRLPAGSAAPVQAWWGFIYPQFCFARPDRDGQKEKKEDQEKDVKISFWLAKALDW